MIRNKRIQTTKKKKSLLAYTHPESTVASQFRTINANIQFLSSEKKSQTILITSPGLREGKSITAANLAVSMAEKKEKVLLIDVDVKNPGVHSIFDVSNEAGLVNILLYDVKIEEVVHKTALETLDVLTAGSVGSYPPAIVGGSKMSSFLTDITAKYDKVIIDSEAVLDCPETKVLAQWCDGVILVAARNKTKRLELEEASRALQLVEANIIGGVLNEI